jgi:hypothetical protein
MPEYGMEISSFAHQARVQNATAGELMLNRFSDTRTTTGKLSREDEQCSLQ